MKKVVLFVLCFLFCISLLACNKGEEKTDSAESVELTGNYQELSLLDGMSINTEFLLHANGIEPEAKLKIDEKEGTFQDDCFRGSITVESDKLVCQREEVIAEPLLKQSAQMQMEQFPEAEYIIYKDYLIENSPLSVEIEGGELPNGDFTDCSIWIDWFGYSRYNLGLSDDGYCEIEAFYDLTETDYFYCGSYEIDGNVIIITMNEGDVDSEAIPYDGEAKMALYISDGEIYGTVYQKDSAE